MLIDFTSSKYLTAKARVSVINKFKYVSDIFFAHKCILSIVYLKSTLLHLHIPTQDTSKEVWPGVLVHQPFMTYIMEMLQGKYA